MVRVITTIASNISVASSAAHAAVPTVSSPPKCTSAPDTQSSAHSKLSSTFTSASVTGSTIKTTRRVSQDNIRCRMPWFHSISASLTAKSNITSTTFAKKGQNPFQTSISNLTVNSIMFSP